MVNYKFGFNTKLGFGSLRFPINSDGNVDISLVCDLFDKYISEGGLYFEAAFNYHQAEATIRKCLVERYPREKYMLADKMPVHSVYRREDYEKIFDEQKKRCGVDFFDFYLLHNVVRKTYLSTEKLGGFEFIQDLKRREEVKWIGFSFHDTADVLDEILSKYADKFDFVQLQINYLDWESQIIQSKLCYEVACKYNLPVFVMEPNKGGRLINLSKDALDIFREFNPYEKPASLALRWVAEKENIACVLSGMNSLSQVEENLKSLRNPIINKQDIDTIIKIVEVINKSQNIQCTSCRYCIPVCPKKIPITELLNLYENDNVGHTGRIYERIIEGKGKASDCIKCGKCEQVCSQRLPIRNYIMDISNEYDSLKSKKYKELLRKTLGRTKLLGIVRNIKHKYNDSKLK